MKTSLFLLLLLLGAVFISVSGAAKPPPAKGKDVKKKGFDNSKEAVELLVLSKKVRNVLISGNLRRASKLVAPNARSLLSKKNDAFRVGGNFVGPKGHIRLYRILTKKLLTAFGKRRLRNKRIIIVPARRKVTYFRRYPGGVKGVRPGRYSITHFFNKNYKLQRIVTKKHRSLKPGRPGKRPGKKPRPPRPPPKKPGKRAPGPPPRKPGKRPGKKPRPPPKRVACIKRCRSKPAKPVCGKFKGKKRTFRNVCGAKCFGVKKTLPGRCRKIGGVGTPPPRKPSPPKKGRCAHCRKQPVKPVCKGRRTYRNACFAKCFKVKGFRPGRCPKKKPPPPKKPGKRPPQKRPPPKKGACRHCFKRPVKPVCKGRRTFRNSCLARCLKVKGFRPGKCPKKKPPPPRNRGSRVACIRRCRKKPVMNVCGKWRGRNRTFRNPCHARCYGRNKMKPGRCPK